MITSDGLEELGFEFFKDFILQDDGDGVYIHDWYSDKPIPSTTEIEQAEQEYIAKQRAIEEKKELPDVNTELPHARNHHNLS